jgi:ribosome maturation factor RimP
MKELVSIDKINELVKPIVEENGYELYHIEFVEEDGDNYLRVYIDKEEGVSLDGCVKINKAVSSKLDEKDPISCSYYLEISSPGIERVLFNDKHLKKYIESNVNVKLKNLLKGKKEFCGLLKKFSEEVIVIEEEGNDIDIPREKISSINLKGEY